MRQLFYCLLGVWDIHLLSAPICYPLPHDLTAALSSSPLLSNHLSYRCLQHQDRQQLLLVATDTFWFLISTHILLQKNCGRSLPFQAQYQAARQDMAHGVSASCIQADETTWVKWSEFTSGLGIRFYLSHVQDPVPILQIFSQQVRDGLLGVIIHRTQKWYFDKYICLVEYIFASVGSLNLQMGTMENIDFRICHQLSQYQNNNPTPTHGRPIPFSILLHLQSLYADVTPSKCATTHLTLLAFLFLLPAIKLWYGCSHIHSIFSSI